jgi:serine/threonine protein kinase
MKMQCALKKISKEKLRENPVYEDLMKDELATLQNVSHPKIMRVFELLQDNTDIYVVTEFIKGGELLVTGISIFKTTKLTDSKVKTVDSKLVATVCVKNKLTEKITVKLEGKDSEDTKVIKELVVQN